MSTCRLYISHHRTLGSDTGVAPDLKVHTCNLYSTLPFQEVCSSVAFMIGIALLLIPHPACAIWVTLAIASIDLGIIGYMTLWGLNIDTISMVTIIMSIGFSVDFTAHIAYAYVANIHEAPDERIRNALGTLAWPVLQGGISTLIGVIVLADLNSYMVVSFFKTVFLVIVFGLLHALVFLPVLLHVSTDPMVTRLLCWRPSAKRSSSPATPVATIAQSKDGPLKRLLDFIHSRICKKGSGDKERTRPVNGTVVCEDSTLNSIPRPSSSPPEASSDSERRPDSSEETSIENGALAGAKTA